jgi:adenylylsulfate reductase subunit A
MQKVMDIYAGGISSNYLVNTQKLNLAKEKVTALLKLSQSLKAEDSHELMQIYDVIDRLYVCLTLIEHLLARKETRWHCFQENADYPEKDDQRFLKYVNSRYQQGKVEILFRDLVTKDVNYEHLN